MSDYEWSVFLINKELNRWQNIYSISNEIIEKYRNFLLNLDDVENIEVRIYGSDIQWKRFKNSRWANIEI